MLEPSGGLYFHEVELRGEAMRAFLYGMFICQLVATASPQQNRSLAVTARNGTETSIVDPTHAH